MFEKQNPQKSERVEDIEKARVMAEAEDLDREFLSRFRAYTADPVAFRAAERERVAQAAEAGNFTREESNDFMYLCQEGVHADDLERLAEQAGNDEGALYNIRNRLKELHPVMIKAQKIVAEWWIKRVSKALDIAFEQAESKLDLSQDPRGLIVAEKLQRLQTSDDMDVISYLNLHRKYEGLQKYLEEINAALEGDVDAVGRAA